MCVVGLNSQDIVYSNNSCS